VPTESSKSLSKREAARLAALARRVAASKKAARAERAYFRWTEKTYGVTEEEYRALLDAQEGRCAICRRRPVNRRLAVDHDHNTGKVRGLLCYTCNHFVLRYVEGDPVAAHNAAVYIALIATDYGPEYAPVLRDSLVEPGSE
jgi:hypothetical protein